MRDGYAAWLDAQLAMPPSQTHFDWLLQQGRNTEEYKGNGINAPLDATLWRKFISAPTGAHPRRLRAVRDLRCERGVHHRVWPLFGAAGFMDLLAEHALGDYRSLLAAVSRNLSMGCMLTFRGSRKEDPRTGRHPDENYAREVMQLFSIGLLQLHPDGTPAGRRRAGGNLYERRRPGPGGSSPAGTWMAPKPTWNSTAGR